MSNSQSANDEKRSEPRRRWRDIWWVRLPAKLALIYLVIVAVMMFLEEFFIFPAMRYPGGEWSDPGIPYEDATFASADGTALHGWFVPRQNASSVILVCHGNGGNVTHRVGIMLGLSRIADAVVLVFDYRGYGKSQGRPNEPGILADARAARAWLAKRMNVPESQIVLYGESLGGAVAVDLAAKDGAKALILDSTFSSIPDVAAKTFWWLPVRLLIRNRFDSASKIGQYHGPLLQFHSPHDSVIPFPLGKKLFDAANEPKQFVELGETDHNDPRPAVFFRTIRQFLDEHR